MTHTARQLAWADAAREQSSGLAAGLFALLSQPSETERAAGITSSPLDASRTDDGPAADAVAAGPSRRCAGCGYLAAESGDTYCAGCRSALDRGADPSEWPPAVAPPPAD